ncbi:galactose-binding domain-like protein [Dioszegia hungarica]|uniref:Galactose-binding domain-like protein n=1 Tax=Dioszegia hungarica TaxID=4972 RepID=A0AA38H2G6_9TREE|nr:galactose-binding domain-like protein [Dioszegia hungarica]KAI9632993.1 galactose-binding domain-like protein [Dioszegia hungarica]
MNCSSEAHDHSHGGGGHSHGHGDHNHEGHDHDIPLGSGPQDSLFSHIDVPNVVALNAVGGGEAGQKVIKSWEEREDLTRFCESDTDDSMIVKIPFTASVSIRSITVKAGPSGQTPREMHLYRDSPGMDFGDTDRAATQVLEMVEENEGVEYQVKAAKFASVSSLTLYFPGNTSDGDEEISRVYYIGLRGSFKPLPGRPGVIIYESAARPQDHKVGGTVSESQGWTPGT